MEHNKTCEPWKVSWCPDASHEMKLSRMRQLRMPLANEAHAFVPVVAPPSIQVMTQAAHQTTVAIDSR